MPKQNTRKLTMKQEHFCQAFTSNRGNASAAYRTAYDTANMKPATVHVKACNMLKRDKVRARLSELVEPELVKYAISRTNMMEELMFAASSGRMKNNARLVYMAVMRLMRVALF